MFGLLAFALASTRLVHGGGTAPLEFLDRLRDGKFFDSALKYLDRADKLPGVDSDFLSSLELERAQTHIDQAFASRSTKDRDRSFEDAETSLKKFLAAGDHPRQSEARLRLGKIQMIRAAQYMSGEPDDSKRKNARDTYTRASETFGQIVEDLRTKLKAVQGAKIDAVKNPEKAKLRDQYKGDFLEAMMNSGEASRMAADTFTKPNGARKKLLESALARFTDLSNKYANYVQGAIAIYKRGQIEEKLGSDAKALSSYLQMMDTVDASELREAKFMATGGLVRLALKQSPQKPDKAINKGEAFLKTVRPNERKMPGVGELQAEVAMAYLAKSRLKGTKGPEKKKAKGDARQWLVKASKIPGSHLAMVKKGLSDLGIDAPKAEETLPMAEEPADFEQAFTGAQQLYSAILTIEKNLKDLRVTKGAGAEKRRTDLEERIAENRAVAVILLRRGLTRINRETDINLVNQGRNLLTFLLYQGERHHDTVVMGTFLSKQAPGTENGLRGGLFALNAMQILLREDPSNQTLTSLLTMHSEYLIKTWPDDPQAAGAKNVMVALALENRDWQKARELIEEMSAGPNQARSRRVLGNMLWVEANDRLRSQPIGAARGQQPPPPGSEGKAKQLMQDARADLERGLAAVTDGLADEKIMREAFVLSRIELRLDNPDGAMRALDHPKYGAVRLASKLGIADDQFASQLYSHELQAVVQSMTSEEADLDKLIARASGTMDQLRERVIKGGENGPKKLAGIYLQLARNIRGQLDTATAAKKAKLTGAFRVFLERVAKTTKDDETLLWIGQTLIQLAESSLQPNQTKVTGSGAELLKTALATFEKLSAERLQSTEVIYQIAQAHRLSGNYGDAINSYEILLKQKPTMINGQMEAALTYELWAGTLPPHYASKSYTRAFKGAKPDAKGKNRIWGWGRIGQITNGREDFREEFFDSRYHLALCRFLAGRVSNETKVMKASISDITKVAALSPEMGGKAQYAKFDALLKRIQKELGEKPVGLGNR